MLPASYKWTLILPFWPSKNSATLIINVKRIKHIGEHLHKWLLEAKLLMGYLAFNLETHCQIFSPQNKGKQNCGTDLQPYKYCIKEFFLALLTTLGIINLLIT